MPSRILTCYYRPKAGGFCKRYFRAIRALVARKHEVHYLAVVPFPIDHPNCHFHRFPWPFGHTDTLAFWAFFHLVAPWLLLYLGIRHRVSHAFVFGPTYGAIMQPLRLVKRIPLALFLRGDTILAHRIKGRARWVVWLDRWIEGLAIWGVNLYAVSESLAKVVLGRHRWLRPRSWGLLRNDILSWNPRAAVTARMPLRLACVGILEPTKNQRLVVECIELLPRGKVALSLYGLGPDEACLRDLAESRSLKDEVRFMGWVDSADIWPEIDLLLMPSLNEGAPNAVIEALGLGIPVLASDIPEHRELLPASSLLPLGDAHAWTSRLQSVIAHPRDTLSDIVSQQSLVAAELCFDWEEEFSRCVLRG